MFIVGTERNRAHLRFLQLHISTGLQPGVERARQSRFNGLG